MKESFHPTCHCWYATTDCMDASHAHLSSGSVMSLSKTNTRNKRVNPDSPLLEGTQFTITYIFHTLLSLTGVCPRSMRLFYFFPVSCPKLEGLCVCVGAKVSEGTDEKAYWSLNTQWCPKAAICCICLPNTVLTLTALSPSLQAVGVTLFLWKCVYVCVVIVYVCELLTCFCFSACWQKGGWFCMFLDVE